MTVAITKRRRGALQVYESLRDDILWLRLEPGSPLDELALADRFQVSRTPVREALLLLSGGGLVKFQPNRTTIVAPLTMDNAGAYHDTLLILSRAVARSAAMSGRADSEVLEAHIGKYSDAVLADDHEAALKADHSFLRHLSSLAGNMFQDQFFDQILDSGVRMKVLHYFANATDTELRSSIADRRLLAEAVTHRDPEESDACISRMIAADIAVIMRFLQPQYGYSMPVTPTLATGQA